MKLLRNFAVILVSAAVFFSCKKERSYENPTGVIIDRNWEFKEAGTTFAGPMDSAFIRTIGVANSLNLSGPSADGKGEITLQILSNGPIVKGAYNNPQVLFQYSLNGTPIFQNSSADNFTINITAIDSVSVSGTFSGVAIDSVGNKQTISDGKFTTALSGLVPPVTGRGSLTLWAKQLCSDNSSIYIRVGDSVKYITIAYPSDPSCGADGTASFNLPAGAYTVIAACGADTLHLNAAVLPDVCATLEVDFSQLANQDYFPLQNKWTYGNMDNFDDDTLAITSTGDTTIGADVFTKFYNDKSGQTNYYRKSNGIYYRYLQTVYGQALTTPIQLIILQDNVDVGTQWESDPYQADFGGSGIPFVLTVKLVSRISQKNYQDSYGGRNYDNCIEVMSELYQQQPDGSWVDADTGFKTVFAKGIGMVYYEDLDSNIDYELRYYNVTP